MNNQILNQNSYQKLAQDITNLINQGKQNIEELMKHQTIKTYWQIGKRISQEKLTNNANYYSLILKQLSEELKIDDTTLIRSVQFFKIYPNKAPNPSSLTWSHYKSLISIKDNNLRLNLEQKAIEQSWTRDQLTQNIKKSSQENIKTSQTKLTRPTKPNYLYKAQIKDVVDGDTLILNINLGFQVIKEQRIRLAQIDTAEIKSSEGKKAFHYLRDLCANLETIIVRTNKIDVYGRYLGDIFFDMSNKTKNSTQIEIFENGSYLNEILVQKGFAKLI